MTWIEAVITFLEKVQIIKRLNPAYKQPGDGSNGVCDCIGLPIGALRRMGIQWSGIHGCNYAARREFVSLESINKISDLQLGDVVLKAYDPNHSKWKLPDRYKKGKPYYNGDLKDYYHAGVVTQISPSLQITHMTSPRMKVDTNLGSKTSPWRFHGRLKLLVKAAGGVVTEELISSTTPVPSAGSKAIVVSANGGAVKCRQYPSTGCATWDRVLPGTEVTILEPGETWAKINCGRRKGWYMMAQYLDVVGDGKGKY